MLYTGYGRNNILYKYLIPVARCIGPMSWADFQKQNYEAFAGFFGQP